MTAGVKNLTLLALPALLVLGLAGCGGSGGSEEPAATAEPTAVPTVVDTGCTAALTAAFDYTDALNGSFLLIREPAQIFTSYSASLSDGDPDATAAADEEVTDHEERREVAMEEVRTARTDFTTARSACDTEAPQNEPCSAVLDLAEEVATSWAGVDDEGLEVLDLVQRLEAATRDGDLREVESIRVQSQDAIDTANDLSDEFDGTLDEYLEAAGSCS